MGRLGGWVVGWVEADGRLGAKCMFGQGAADGCEVVSSRDACLRRKLRAHETVHELRSANPGRLYHTAKVVICCATKFRLMNPPVFISGNIYASGYFASMVILTKFKRL